MNIILGEYTASEVKDQYVVLELDRLRISQSEDPITAFCVVDKIPVGEMLTLEHHVNLHSNLIRNYRLKNWNYCEQALEHLVGKWNGAVDTFYHELTRRISQFKENDPGADWDAVVDKVR